MGPHLRGAGEREDISCVEVAQRELERPTPGVNLRVGRKDLDDVSVSTRLDVEATGAFSVFALLPQRGIFTMRIEDHARHPVFHQLLDQHAGDVGLAASRFRQNRHVLLDHRVDVEVHRHIVAREETDVRAVLLVLLKPDHLLNRGGLGLVHGLARPKRGARDLQERSEEHPSELHSHSGISYAVFCLKTKKNKSEIKSHICITNTILYNKKNKTN